MNRVEIARHTRGAIGMIVCCEAYVTDAAILAHCNQFNPSGTKLGWTTVVRNQPDLDRVMRPLPCADHSGRIHLMVLC